ncbi:type II toxin-antitoxin system death-on-curing family toxin [Lentilactobacillus hilgardii]|uniref:type II toxin-antitoxin system death-on-curing family toxin n=1 Tax=Lentilactobacillus hilgardii TaxID=1588 RepID=UPI0021A600E5|nr:type II toxin-antitoxin system death-on-curing family toxin [Lentilactobacillus hilgardii]
MGNLKFSEINLQNTMYTGIVLDAYHTKEQYMELLILVAKSYLMDNKDQKIDEIKIEPIGPKKIRGIIISKNGSCLNNLLIMNTSLVIPTIGNLVEWNSRAQEIYPERGVYGIKGIKSPEDVNRLKYTLDFSENSKVYGEDQLPTVATKAAFLWERIAGTQAFKNGNKRTAMLTMLIMLHSNGYDFLYHRGLKEELVKLSLKIAVGDIDLEQIKNYIVKNCRINYNNTDWDTIKAIKNEPVVEDNNWEK